MKKHFRLLLLSFLSALLLAAGVLLAACDGDTVTLTFRDGTADTKFSVTPGETVTLPAPEKEGSAFMGWYAAEDFSGTRYEGTMSAPEADATYFARWETGYALTLSVGEDTPYKTLWLAEGENLLAAVEGLSPMKNGLPLSAWSMEGRELTERDAMPASALTLTAKFRVGYIVEQYFENVAGNAYVGANSLKRGSGYLGDTVTAEAPAVEHFTLHEGEIGDAVTSLTLGEDPAKNVFRFYYDRTSYPVIFAANAPNGTTAVGTMSEIEVPYQGSVSIPACAFSVEGYRFAGWSLTSGDVDCTPGSALEVEAPMLLSAVWDRGYRDRFGGGDLIFFPRTDSGKAVLQRGGQEFEGTRTGDSFSFTTAGGSVLGGTVRADGTFSYHHPDIAGTYELYTFDGQGGHYDDTTTLEVSSDLGAVYTAGGKVTEGTLFFDDGNGDYTFEGGTVSFNCRFAKDGTPGAEHPAYFAIAGEEAGIYVDFWLVDRETGQGFSNGEVLILDGYNGALLYQSIGVYPVVLSGSYTVDGRYGQAGVPIFKITCDIVDSYGIIGEEGEIIEEHFYTTPPGPEGYGNYIFADDTRGTYGQGGETLVLDGFGIFFDSAVYTKADGTELAGSYDVTVDYKTGMVASFTASGTSYRFLLGRDGTFSPLGTDKAGYVEYYRLEEGLGYPLLVLYDDLTAEIYVTRDKGESVKLGAKGKCTEEKLGDGYTLYTFTRTELIEGFGEEVPAHLVFYTTAVIGSEDFRQHGVYVVLEYDDDVRYDEIAVSGGGTLLANRYPSLAGVGSLLITAKGEVIEGSFTRTTGGYFMSDVATFLYGSASGNVTLRYTIATADDGSLTAIPAEFSEQQLYIYYYDEEQRQGRYVVDLVLDGQGNAVFIEDHGEGARRNAAYEEVAKTVFGDAVYSLVIGGQERFRFLIYQMADAAGNLTPVYFIYDRTYDGSYTAEGGGTLVLDGFNRASYTGADGSFERGLFSAASLSVIYFTREDSSGGRYFELGGDRAYELDMAYGEWYLINSSYAQIGGYVLTFDGRGHFTMDNGRTQGEGYYDVLDENTQELLLTGSFGSNYPFGVYRAQLIFYEGSNTYACVIYDVSTFGYYTDGDWNVLHLDGYGLGTLYTADRGFAGSGYYYVVDEEKGFLDFTFDAATEQYGAAAYLVLDNEHHTFEIQDYSSYGQLYLTPQLDYISFGTDGTVRIGSTERGYYLVEKDAVHVYLTDYEREGFLHQTLPALTGGQTYSYNGAEYFLWDGKPVEIGGNIELYGEDGEKLADREPIAATVRFTPAGGANYDLDALFVIGGEEYAGFTLNFYTDGVLAPRVTYGVVDYEISFDYHQGDAAGSTFTVKAGFKSLTLQDYRENYVDTTAHRGGEIVKTFIGFGPILFGAPVYSGRFHYLYDAETFSEPIVFGQKSGNEVTVNAYNAAYGDGYEIVFDFKGTTYAVDFYEYDTYFTLLSFSRYERVAAGTGYEVGVKYLEYCNVENTPGYGFLEKMRGKPCNATLFKDGAPVVALDSGYALAGDAVWIVGYDENSATHVGDGYYISFKVEDGKVASAAVEKYTFSSVLSDDGTFLAYLFFDGKELKHVLAMGYSNGAGGYTWLGAPNGYTEEDGRFSFNATGATVERHYTVVLIADEQPDGKTRYLLRVTET